MGKMCIRCGEILPQATPHFCGPEQTVMLALLARAEQAEVEISACHEERVWALNQMTDAQMECGQLRAELARLTTLRPAIEHNGEAVLWWKESDGGFGAVQVSSLCPSNVCFWWTPIPEPKEAEK